MLYEPQLFIENGEGTAARLQLWNAFASLAGEPLPLTTGTFTVSFATAPDTATLGCRVSVAEPAGEVFAVLERFPFAEIAPVELSPGDLAALPPDFAEALLEGVLALVASLVPPGSDLGDARVAGLARAGAVPAGSEWLRLTIESASREPIAALVGLSRQWLLDYLARHTLPASRRAGPLAERVLLPADITLGSIALTRAELAALEPGDVTVLPERAAGSLTVRVGETAFEFSPVEGGYASSGPRPIDRPRPVRFRPETAAMSDTPEAEAPARSLDEIAVAVDFDLGRVDVPFATIASWTPGTVVALGAPATEPGVAVTIRVNGEAVGAGDLVRLDDRVGVRITRLLPL
ncbi:FliM/FliN family flagellar motor switch protein [Aureimonas leprariae]|uniref:Flagellar motor switch protein FliN-like C-terminal domain-containing protein n=1 Tax=Plantimonas leprariae TaxID=2615207 RepID=A0A7V7PL57_9HYPH|nr:FliM/FliN family flagellar motor switch protein [Aureimonas leprariae]KAB0676846.1 hypothetical protein F6X38_19945 [Aureimonas leprariae]